MRTKRNLLPLLLYVALLSGCFVSSIHARQGNALRVFMKMKATTVATDILEDLNSILPDFNPELIPQEGSKETDKISNLPGQPSGLNISQYGGYIAVDKTAGRALYYYFVEADSNKDSKPVLLWFNGGPGCSSLGFGAFEELGPFLVKKDGLIENPYSWHKLGNILFLESPAGVGFSYSNTTSDYASSTGDKRTAQEAYTFLINWLERFPEYKNKDFYLTGESYAGHYVPQLAYTILQQNKKGDTFINLKGISIGNPGLNEVDDVGIQSMGGSLGYFEYLWRHNLISNEDFNTIQKTCDFNLPAPNRTNECQVPIILNYLRVGDNIDSYHIYNPMCNDDNSNVTSGPLGTGDPCSHKNIVAYLNRPEVVEALHAKITRFDEGFRNHGTIVGKWDKWEDCREVFVWEWQDTATSILPILKHLIEHGIPVLVFSLNELSSFKLEQKEGLLAFEYWNLVYPIPFDQALEPIAQQIVQWPGHIWIGGSEYSCPHYDVLFVQIFYSLQDTRPWLRFMFVTKHSGDLDAVIPYTSTRDSMKRLGLVEQKKWHLWGNNEISGSMVVYEGNLTFATVRGAGHEVPLYQPRRAFELLQSFIEGKRLPKAKTREDLSELGINQTDDMFFW